MRDYVCALLKPGLFAGIEGRDEVTAVWAVANLVTDILSSQDGAAARAAFLVVLRWRRGVCVGL
jgi:hypothetical protein